MNSYQSTASFGKRQEYVVIAELLRRRFDVYQTLVDCQGIDCVIRQEKDVAIRYLEVQIKARSKECDPKNAGTFAAMYIPKPHPNYHFIFYSEQVDTFWVVPSLDLVKEAIQNKSGKNAGKYSIHFCNAKKNGEVSIKSKFDKYKDNFDSLRWE